MTRRFEPLVIANVQCDEVSAEQAEKIKEKAQNVETNPAFASWRALVPPTTRLALLPKIVHLGRHSVPYRSLWGGYHLTLTHAGENAIRLIAGVPFQHTGNCREPSALGAPPSAK